MGDPLSGDPLFAPPTTEWTPLSPRFTSYSRVTELIGTAVFAPVLGGVLWWFLDWRFAVAALGLMLVWSIWQWFRVARLARSWGYAERESDLYVKHGLWFRTLSVIPYGRMQAVQVSSGPIMRSFGLAQVQLITASMQTEATIPGLDAAAAAALRDRLTVLGEAQAAAL